ncbi:MAG: efflux RND transporter periplasmic adaptor subunit [Robiginitomaculum sp.]|nr:efflux RND transporter periplasmic adaptor subunit [Robiginitomaculum sp.]
MRHLKWILPILVLLVAIFAFRIISKMRPEAPVAERVDKRPGVTVINARPINYQPVIHTQGTVRPKTSIELVPEVAGKIIWVSPSFSNGGAYKKGETLIRIDPRNYEFAIEAAQANVANAQAALAREIAEGEIAKQDWDDISGGRAATDLALRKPQLAGAQATLASANAALNKAKLDLQRTNITAPFAGRVDVKRSGLGQYVSLGKVLADLYSTDAAEIHLPLTDTQMGKIDLDPSSTDGKLKVRLFANVGGKRQSWQGQLARTSGAVDQASRVLNLIVEVNDPYGVKNGGPPLLNGLFVEAEIPGVALGNVIQIPRKALRAGNRVVTLDTDNKIHSRTVELVHTAPGIALIRGIEGGTPIVISALELVIEGTQVDPSRSNASNRNGAGQ